MMSQFWDDVYHMRSLSIYGLFIQSQGREVTHPQHFCPQHSGITDASGFQIPSLAHEIHTDHCIDVLYKHMLCVIMQVDL